MDSKIACAFVGGCGLLILMLMFAFSRPSYSEMTKEIVNRVQQSTNIVEALQKENLVIRKVHGGSEADTVEIIVEYNFLHKTKRND